MKNRKLELLACIVFILILVGFSPKARAQDLVKGVVFEDSNQNGKRDKREKGIEGVVVTNGREVVQTDVHGFYKLPVIENTIISVIKPSGYALPLDENNLPGFYYIHRPEGSPPARFQGVEPTGRLPRSVDFGLMRTVENENFTALIFGDPQPYTLEEVNFFKDGIVSEVEGIKDIQFGLSLGDLVGNDLTLFKPYIEAVKRVGVPWFNVMGNHDMNFDAMVDQLSDETYEAVFGPNNYAFNYGKVHFIVLDDILYPDPRDSKGYWGGLRKDQLDFVENDLKYVDKDKLIALAFHIPLTEPGGDHFRDEDRERLFEILQRFPHTLSLSAHTHIQKQEFLGEELGWKRAQPHHHYNVGTSSGDWYSGELDKNGIPVSTMRDGTPKGYAFIDFKANRYNVRYKVAGRPSTYQIEIFNPKVVARGRRSKAGIYANFFIGSERDSLSYRVDKGEWKSMQYVEETDPSYVQQLFKWDLSDHLLAGRRASNAIESKHLWRAQIPVNLEEGEHTIEVRAIDMFGNVYMGNSTYRLEEEIKN